MKPKIMFLILFLLTLFSNLEYQINNAEVYYPKIDNEFINTYINKKVDNFNNNGKLFIDYDYVEEDNMITIYHYELENNKVKYQESSFLVKDTIKKINKEKEVYYDFYLHKEIDPTKKMIAFTFDDGPNYNTTKVLNVLDKYHVKGTFFILGSRIKGNEKIIEKMSQLDMEIGNHTYSHRLLTRMDIDNINNEINKTNDLIFKITNKYPILLRPSYGSVNNKVKKNTNMPIILWNLDPLDWRNHDSKKIANRILKKVMDGDIILLHDIYSATVNALDIVIPKLIEMDYQIVTVSEMFYYKNMNLEKGKTYFYAK